MDKTSPKIIFYYLENGEESLKEEITDPQTYRAISANLRGGKKVFCVKFSNHVPELILELRLGSKPSRRYTIRGSCFKLNDGEWVVKQTNLYHLINDLIALWRNCHEEINL